MLRGGIKRGIHKYKILKIEIMKKSNSVEIIDTKFILSQKQQVRYRDRLKQLVKNVGIISICLDNESLYIEYTEDILNKASIRELLLDINFPMKKQLIQI